MNVILPPVPATASCFRQHTEDLLNHADTLRPCTLVPPVATRHFFGRPQNQPDHYYLPILTRDNRGGCVTKSLARLTTFLFAWDGSPHSRPAPCRWLIRAEPGMGLTTLLLWSMYVHCKEGSDWVPIYVPVSETLVADTSGPWDLVQEHIEEIRSAPSDKSGRPLLPAELRYLLLFDLENAACLERIRDWSFPGRDPFQPDAYVIGCPTCGLEDRTVDDYIGWQFERLTLLGIDKQIALDVLKRCQPRRWRSILRTLQTYVDSPLARPFALRLALYWPSNGIVPSADIEDAVNRPKKLQRKLLQKRLEAARRMLDEAKALPAMKHFQDISRSAARWRCESERVAADIFTGDCLRVAGEPAAAEEVYLRVWSDFTAMVGRRIRHARPAPKFYAKVEQFVRKPDVDQNLQIELAHLLRVLEHAYRLGVGQVGGRHQVVEKVKVIVGPQVVQG